MHVPAVLMGVREEVLIAGLHRDQVDRGMPDATLCLGLVRKATDGSGRSPQNYSFETMLVIEMNVHGRDDQVMMLVLRSHQPFGQIALMVVVHVREARHAVCVGLVLDPVTLDFSPQEVPHRFRPTAIATLCDQRVELLRKRVVD